MAPKEKILVAMSGGVDSSVAAAQLVEQGYDVAGAYMKIWVNEVEPLGECPQQQDIEDARAVAARLGIPFEVVNLMQEYRDHVVSYLLQGYGTGVTPNPDAMCNRFIKFGHFLQYARSRGFDAVATGHYARRVAHPDGSAEILTGLDRQKDQTYFLALLNQDQARAARFPIGAMEKAEVRALAARYGLANAAKKDSQGICFIGEIKMADFLRAFMPDAPGPIVDPEGRPLGTHPGLHYFTLGQAKGLGVPSNRFGEKYVVVAKRPATRELVVAFDRPDSAGLYATACTINSVGFIRRPVDAPRALEVRPRYRCPSQAAHFEPLGEGRARLVFERPQRALTPGQVAALYDGERLLGGGVFETIDPAP